ncbi:MAG: ABC transporter permease subunit [Anaerolineae bacterium]|nr:ABC transporter permease subunit [Anaerolineae bacterium]
MSARAVPALRRPAEKRRAGRGLLGALLTRVVLVGACVASLFPAVWVVAASFNAGTSLYSGGLIPARTTARNYLQLFIRGDAGAWLGRRWQTFLPAALAVVVLVAALVVTWRGRERIRPRRLRALCLTAMVAGIVVAGRFVWASLDRTDFVLWMTNSLIVCIPASLLSLSLTVTMAYAFSRFRFPGRRFGLLVLILMQMFPAIMSIVAIFRLLQIIHLLDSHLGLILVYGGSSIAFSAWLLKGYLDSIPRDLEEAAYIDGATRWQAFTLIAFPLATPMLAVVFLFSFIGFYQEFLIASIVLFRPELRTIALGLRFYISARYAENWTGFAAASIVASAPILVIFYALQRYMVEGLTKGALRG